MILNSIFSKIIKIYKGRSQNNSNSSANQGEQERTEIDSKASSQAIRNNFLGQNSVNLEPILNGEEKEKRFSLIKTLNTQRESVGAKSLDEKAIQTLMKLSSKQFERANELLFIEKRGKYQIGVNDSPTIQGDPYDYDNKYFAGNISDLLGLTDEQFERAKRLCFIPNRKNQFYSHEIKDLAQMPKEDFPWILELAYIKGREESQFNATDIKWLLSLSTAEFQRATSFFCKKVQGYSGELEYLDGYDIKELVAGTDKRTQELLYIKERGENQFSKGEISSLLRLSNKEYEKAKELLYIKGRDEYGQLSADEITSIALWLDDEQFERAKEFLYIKERGENQFGGIGIIDLARLDEEKLNKVRSLFYLKNRKNNQFDGETIAKLAELTDKQIEKVKTFPAKHKILPKEIVRLAKLDDYDTNIAFHIMDIENRTMWTDEIISLFEDISKKPFKERKEVYDSLKRMVYGDICKDKYLQNVLNQKLREFQKSLGQITTPLPVSKEDNNEFWSNFLVTANKNNLETIKNLSPVIEKYGKKGLPLEYPRINFIKDLNSKLSKLPKDKQEEILKKLDINLVDNNYEGFVNLNNLNSNNPEEAEIQNLCEKFLLKNKISTGNEKFDKLFNGIIKGVPEFINIIGKRQHKTHNYSLDLHILKVLQEFVSNPKFENLSNKDKMVSQLMILFHDIGKKGDVPDYGHEFTSAIIANDIMQKFKLPEFTKRRIVELIKNHNWLQQVGQNTSDIKEIALLFRNPKDFDIAEIFAEADLKGVGGDFYDIYGGLIKPSIAKIKESLNEFYSSGNMLFPTRILDEEKIPEIEYKGNKYRVLDVTETKDDEDLSKVGLSVKNKKDLRFLYHMGNLETLEDLLKPTNNSMLSMSLISPDKRITYGYESDKIGVMLDITNSNIGISYPENFRSGWEKDFHNFAEMVFKESAFDEQRKFQSEKIKEALSQKYNIKKIDYAELYKALIDKQFLGQIEDVKLPNGLIINGKDIIKAYKYSENELIKNSNIQRNEIVAYNPQMKGLILMGTSMDEIPESTLKFVKKHNLPIFIMGNRV